MNLIALLALVLIAPTADDDAPVRIVAATAFGTAGEDRLEGAAFADDGSIYVTGTVGGELDIEAATLFGKPVAPRPHAYKHRRTGKELPAAQYGHGVVIKLSDDGTKVLASAVFTRGVCQLTSVVVSNHGVYVSGYATVGIEPLIADLGGLRSETTTQQYAINPYIYKDHHTDDAYDHRRDVRGNPFVLRLSHDLKRIEAGTVLEGWQSMWHVPRPLGEDRWQPVDLDLTADGDVVVVHDGGYQAPLRDGQREPTPHHFFHAPDHLSRLSPDLKVRRWHVEIVGAAMDAQKINRHYPAFDWKLPHLGQARVLRMRVDAKRNRIAVGGWVPSQTSNEPWWSPFLHVYDTDGRKQWSVYTPDPMSGKGDRMNGLVSDAAIRAVNFDDEGNVLLSGIGDGGNSILRRDPRDYARPAETLHGSVHSFHGRTLFWGMVGRVDAERQALLAGNHVAGFGAPSRDGRKHKDGKPRLLAAWATDVAPCGAGALVIGRHTGGFSFSDKDALPDEEPSGFLRLYDQDFRRPYSMQLRDVHATAIAQRGERYVIIGSAVDDQAITKAAALTRGKGVDAYWLVIDARASGLKQP